MHTVRIHRFKNNKFKPPIYCIICLGILCFGFTVVCFVFMFGLNFTVKTCNSDITCLTKDPCVIDQCVDSCCSYEKRKNCCVEDEDCGSSECHTSFCDFAQHVCRVSPKLDGTSCDDGDVCTVGDTCVAGVCTGKSLSCDINNQCRTGQCIPKIGCVFDNKPNELSCDDHNPCTSEDECFNGMCALGIPKDCSSLSSICSIGACDISNGNCITMAQNEDEECDDGLMCTINDKCTNGVCTGVENLCLDNNPCTINKCVEGIGCMIQHQDNGETCIAGCSTQADCPFEFDCFDGTCVKTDNNVDQTIRMIGYEIEKQSSGLYKLKLHFTLDTTCFQLVNETRYRTILSVDDIEVDDQYSELGFGSEIIHLQSQDFGNCNSRTSFTIATEEQTLTEYNCMYLFTNRQYRFSAKMYDCLDINTVPPSHCFDPSANVVASVQISIASCSDFPQHIDYSFKQVGSAVLYYKDQVHRGYNEWLYVIANDDSKGTVGIETPMYSNPNVKAIITDMSVCVADSSHYLASCVDHTNKSMCYNNGCFDWDEMDSPLLFKVDIMKESEMTSLALTPEFLADGCYENDDYNANMDEICTWEKCNINPGMDDGISFIFKPFLPYIGHRIVFDVKYQFIDCHLNHTESARYARVIN